MTDLNYYQCDKVKFKLEQSYPKNQEYNLGWCIELVQGDDFVRVAWHKTKEAAKEHIKLLKKAINNER